MASVRPYPLPKPKSRWAYAAPDVAAEVKQFVQYLAEVFVSEWKDHLVREERWFGTSGVSVV